MATKKIQKKSLPVNLLLVSISVTITALVCYFVASQSIRDAANGPQAMVAEEIAEKLTGGESPQKDWLGRGKVVELSLDSRTFFIIYDSQGNIATTSAMLNGEMPKIPQSLLDQAAAKGEHKVTWEPTDGVREALVIKPYQSITSSGYVVAGRSLERAEALMRTVGAYIFLVWLAMISLAVAFAYIMSSHKKTGR